jgi:hypothetical protein
MPQLALRTQRLSSTSGTRSYFSILASNFGGAGGSRRIAKWTAQQCRLGTGPCYYQQIKGVGIPVNFNGSSFGFLNNTTPSSRIGGSNSFNIGGIGANYKTAGSEIQHAPVNF